MIEPGIPPKVSAADAALYGAGKSDKASGAPGFSEALSDAGQKNANATDEETGDPAADDLPVAQETEGTEPETQAKPIIDIKPPSLRGGPLQQGAAAALSLFQSARLQTQTNATEDGAADQAGTSEQSAEEATTVGARKAGEGDASKLAEQVEKVEKVKTGKADASDPAEQVGEGLTTSEQVEAATGAVDEVMNLLVTAGDELASAASQPLRGKAEALATKADAQTNGETGKVNAVADARDALEVDALPGVDGEDAAQATEADSGPSFRAVRADGKGQPLALRADGSGADGQAAGTGEASPTVSVLDARRFIAPVSTSNAANIAAAMSGDREWVSAMQPGSELANAATQSSAGKVVNTLKIQMSPVDLGSVTATMRLTGETLTVQLTVENSAAYRKLNEDQNEIVKTLRSQGYAIDSVQISMASSADRTANDGGQASQQQANQQTGQGGGQQSSGSAGRDSGSSSSFGSAFNSQGTTSDDTTAANAVSGGVAGSRTGGVYL